MTLVNRKMKHSAYLCLCFFTSSSFRHLYALSVRCVCVCRFRGDSRRAKEREKKRNRGNKLAVISNVDGDDRHGGMVSAYKAARAARGTQSDEQWDASRGTP